MYKCSVWRVFVPMFWECSFTHTEHAVEAGTVLQVVFVPMFGECSFTIMIKEIYTRKQAMFSSPCLGNVLSLNDLESAKKEFRRWFSSPCLGNVLSLHPDRGGNAADFVFSSPCLGNVLSPVGLVDVYQHLNDWFSSPCLGNVLSQDTAYETAAVERFSSPCLGNLLSLWSYWG